MYKRVWFWLLVIVAVVIIAVASTSTGSGGSTGSAQTGSAQTGAPASAQKQSPSVSRGLGSQDASGDVKVGRLRWQADTGMAQATVTITNHSSKRSDYFIDLSLESANGKVQLDTASVAVNNLESGQASKQQAMFFSLDHKPGPGARIVLKSVDRLASS